MDYAILMTTKYKKARYRGADKRDAVVTALQNSIQSVLVSAFSFFAATFGVGMYSNIDMISSMFMVFDKVICATSAGFRSRKVKEIDVTENNVSMQ